jgi:gliding motility-associated-like protein
VVKRVIFLLILFIASRQAFSQTAAFDADKVSGCTPLVVKFTDRSVGANRVIWDFGNGRGCTTCLPGGETGTIYDAPGTFTVTLIAYSATGSDTARKTITVDPSPVVDFSFDKSVGCFPMPVKFTDNTSFPSGTITSWRWDFGDGNISTEQNPTHIYRFDNVVPFSVTLTVTSSNGCAAVSETKSDIITVNPGVRVGFYNSFASSCKPPSNIDFFNTSTGPGVMSYSWRFGDGSPLSNIENPSHVYNAVGMYNATLIASSSDGCTDSVTNLVDIPNVNISSAINAPDTACANAPVIFTNISTPPADSSGWKFGDGTEDTGPSVTKIYRTPGTYNVTLTNLFGSCLDSVVKRIVILDTPRVNFISADTANCRAPYAVRFTDQSVGAVSWRWDFGDGNSSTSQNPSNTYNNLGKYPVTLTITNRNGCVSRARKTDFIKIVTPSMTFLNLPDSGCAPVTVTPQVKFDVVDGVTSYFWNFGDGFTTSQQNPSRTYNTTGTYTVSLAITTGGGCLQTLSLPAAVKVGSRPTANFTGAPTNLCAGEPVSFLDLSSGQKTGWRWDFGDTANGALNGSTQPNPIYQYADTGTFTVKLYVFNNGCVDSVIKPNFVRAYGAVARFNYTVNCTNKREVSFRDSSLNAQSITWDFGDGTIISGQANPVHTFPALGSYNVKLTAIQGSCTYVLTKRIRIIDEKANFNISPNVLCRGAVTTLTATAIDSNIRKYEWDYGNGVLDSGRNIFTHVYDTPRVYNARLFLTDINGCKDSTTRSIGVGGPRARFTALNPTGCVGITVNFADSSLSDGVNAIVNRVWSFGDGAVQTINNPPVSHQYLVNGFFNVKLRVTDAAGCTDSLVRNSYVVASAPRALFTSPDSLSCPGKNVQFLTQSTGASLSYRWDFGDGNFNTLSANPRNTYAATGTYDVKLRITDRFGCSDSLTKPDFVLIDVPRASFTISDSVINCPPLKAKFDNTSSYYQTWRFQFGDGGLSVNNDTPSHDYGLPGNYIAKLIITSPGGCVDSAFKNITVYGPNGVLSAIPSSACLPATIDFSVSTTNTDSVIWDFGDGSPLLFTKDTVKQHTYTNKYGDLLPRVLLKDATGCPVVINLPNPIKVIGIEPGFISDKVLVCDRGFINFLDTTRTNGAIQLWEWDFGDGVKGTGANPSHYYNNTGFYDVKLKITTELGCTDSVTIPRYIKSVASPVANIQSADTACLNRFITYRGNVAPDTSAVTWNWNFANGNVSTLQNPPTQQYTVPGTFSVSLLVTNSSGCIDTVLKAITIHPLPQVDAGRDTTLCLGQSSILNASGASIYQWLPPTAGLGCTNCATPLASPTITTLYRLRGTSAQGCQVDDSVKVTVVQPSTVVAPPNDSLCLGVGMRLVASGTEVYNWSPATGLNDPNTSSPIARPTTTTTYVITGSDLQGCFVTQDSVTISVFPYPVFDLGPDVTIPVGSGTKFNPVVSNDIISVRWSPVTALSCTDCFDPVASPKQKTQYSATVVNNGGCTVTDQITVFVVCTNENLFIPNTFSPNGDGTNEVFYPRGRGIMNVKSMRIFSRWGQQVYWRQNFMANDISAGWDGTFKGQKLSSDVYVYMIDVICENNTVVTLKGDIMLVR